MVTNTNLVRHSLHFSLLILCLVALLGQSQARAAEEDSLEQKIDSTFTKMMANPSDVDVTLEYANLVIEAKDYEAAIPALERILFFNPELNEIKLRLGVMYYNLESYNMAKEYIQSVAKNATNKELVDQANSYLSKM